MQDAGGNPRAPDGLSTFAGRFAPTPSGALHQGSLVAALASRCDALANGHAWFLRIDDIDPPRIQPGAIDGIIDTLRAFGFVWDGDVRFQSSRHRDYAQALQALIETGRVFCCTCSRRQCGADGRCLGNCHRRVATPETLQRLSSSDAVPVSLRLSVSPDAGHVIGDVDFVDRICGEQRLDPASASTDIILRRRDGLWSYALACAVDDSDGISDVIRGADLLEATFAQRRIMHALHRSAPRYAHVPVARDASGRKLGKQTQAPPLDPAQALPSLMQAWNFLGQSCKQPPTSLAAFWQRAASEWSLAKVPATGVGDDGGQ